LGNGSRFYIDCGAHPEFCTPEVDNPWDVVCYTEAGAELLQGLASELQRAQSGPDLRLFRCNVDYLTHATWACHENYGHRTDPLGLPLQIIPHLVSRIIYTGAGGLNPFSPGIEFCLSPRVYHLDRTTSSSSTDNRGIFHLKDESLGGRGWHRLHVLSGDSLCSQLGTWLKAGTTALVVALVEGGFEPGQAVGLQDPVQAMRRFNGDVSLRRTARLMNGWRLTALDVQWHYLRFVRAHLGHPCLPVWAEAVCTAWQEMLERLARGPVGARTRIDWAIKHALYLEHLRQRQVSPEELAAFNESMRPPCPPTDPSAAPADGSDSTDDAAEADLPAPPGKRITLNSAQHRKLQQVRAELCELEVRFGQLGPQGLFAALDQAGLLQHRLAEVTPERVHQAVREPPSSGRARLRGRVIQQLHGRGGHLCDWHSVWTENKEKSLDLSDPLQEEMPAWIRSAPPVPAEHSGNIEQRFGVLQGDYELGHFERAFATLGEIAGLPAWPVPSALRQYHDMLALVQCRRGFFPAAIAALNARARTRLDSISSVYEYVAIHRFQGLVPGNEIWEWIRLGDALLDQHPEPDSAQAFGFREHKARALLHRGRLDEAKVLLQQVLAETGRCRTHPRMFALAMADLGEVHRRLGEPDLARSYFDSAERLQIDGLFFGDQSEFTLLNRAKLESATGDVSRLLDRAESMQDDTYNRMGLARTLILRARLLPGQVDAGESVQRILEIRDQLPSLQACPLCTQILSAWDDWCAGRPPPDDGEDSFWGM
jgi:tetratricopeptide (TPR) repeat protein